MMGTNPMQDGAILPVANGPKQPELLGMAREWQAGLSLYMATPATFGRGVLSASNKPSETNIGNIPVTFTQWQTPPLRQIPQTARVISNLIPGGNG